MDILNIPRDACPCFIANVLLKPGDWEAFGKSVTFLTLSFQVIAVCIDLAYVRCIFPIFPDLIYSQKQKA
jgi:hypothetical protein